MFDNLVAAHTPLNIRDTCYCGFIGIDMAIHTRDIVITSMYFMAKCDGLSWVSIGKIDGIYIITNCKGGGSDNNI
ncbi:MAG: hypothetical protein A3K22_06085 [Deltaproteobacteria bacterium RBG_16_42_7]|nr:MAG: hypothetical protein A3K22_06085 [Deltaproteobacteria bacterium RBG_16_42_7]